MEYAYICMASSRRYLYNTSPESRKRRDDIHIVRPGYEPWVPDTETEVLQRVRIGSSGRKNVLRRNGEVTIARKPAVYEAVEDSVHAGVCYAVKLDMDEPVKDSV